MTDFGELIANNVECSDFCPDYDAADAILAAKVPDLCPDCKGTEAPK